MNDPIRAILFDLDGTLLRERGNVDKRRPEGNRGGVIVCATQAGSEMVSVAPVAAPPPYWGGAAVCGSSSDRL